MPSTPPSDPSVSAGAAGVASDGGDHASNSFRAIALWEAVKGVLILIASGIAIGFLAPDQQHAVERFVALFHLNPTGHTTRIFVRAMDRLDDINLVLFAGGVLAYVLLHFVEAWGLWFQKPWGWILGLVSAGIFLPFEIEHLVRRFTWPALGVFIVNLVIVVVLWRNRTKSHANRPSLA